MELSGPKTGKSIILKYILTGFGGFSLGIVIGILIYIVASILNLFPMNSEIIIFIFIISITGFGSAFFGIVSEDIKKTIHYGTVGTAIGILSFYCFIILGQNYYLVLFILPAWGFAIGLPTLKNAVKSGSIALGGGIFISLLILLISSLPINPQTFFVLTPLLLFFSLLAISTVIGLAAYSVIKVKESRIYFNSGFLNAGTISIKVLIIGVLILTAIFSFLTSMSEPPGDLVMEYKISITSDNQEQYTIYFPFLVDDIESSKMFKSVTLSGNGTYSVAENIKGAQNERIRALAISGRGNITFKAKSGFNKISEATRETEVCFQGKNRSVIMNMEGSIRGFGGHYLYFNMGNTLLIEGWQKVSVKVNKYILE